MIVEICLVFLSIFIGFLWGIFYCRKKLYYPLLDLKRKNEKFKAFYDILVRWHMIRGTGNVVEKYLLDRGYKSIAIYGMKELGVILFEELKDSAVSVKYAIDRNASSICRGDIRIVTPDSEMDAVDAVVVTVIQSFDEIKDSVYGVLKCPVISIEDILFQT